MVERLPLGFLELVAGGEFAGVDPAFAGRDGGFIFVENGGRLCERENVRPMDPIVEVSLVQLLR